MTSMVDGRLVHTHTHNTASASATHRSSGATNYQIEKELPLMATTPGLRYSLTKGTKAMTSSMQKASRSSVALALRRNSSTSQDVNENPANDEPTTTTSPVKPQVQSPKSVADASQMIKIFVLLLEPKTKTFELIQLVYPSATTTVGDILRMIPQHATELTLGSQKYVGLCRPKDDKELSDLSQLASAGGDKNGKESARVCTGEILVGIPTDYSVPEVSKFSQAILTNRRFTKLLRRSNPLTPKMRKHSDRKKDRKHKHKHRSRDAVHILEKHDEIPEDAAHDEQTMQRALENAANLAAQANADVPICPDSAQEYRNRINTGPQGYDNLMGRSPRQSSPIRSDAASVDSSLGASYDSTYASFSWVDGGASTYSISTAGDSLGDSLSSWSKSLDASFAKGRPQYARHRNLSRTSSTVESRRSQQQKSNNLLWFGVLAVVVVAYLLGSYLKDPQRNFADRSETVKNSPMGLPGLILVMSVLGGLRKVQFLSNRRRQRRMNNKHYVPKPRHQSACPAVRFYAKFNKMFS